MAEDKIENGQKQEVKVENPISDDVKSDKKDKPVNTEEAANENEAEEKNETEEEKIETEEEKKETLPELLTKIKNQIEYYFGNVNMQRDKFLNDQVKLDDGWVPLSVMLSFKMLASLSKDVKIILTALEDSDLIEVSEDKKKIRRSPKHPLPVYDEEYKKAQEERSVYVKGFPQESTTMEMLKVFFAPYEPIEHIFMRRYKDKNDKNCFKGSIFVQFTTLDQAKKFMEIESLKYNNTELIRKWSKDYSVEKAKEREEMRAKRDKKKNKDSKPGNDKQDKEKAKNEIELPKGCILHITGLTDNISREEIKEEIVKIEGNVAYIEYKKENTEAWVRLQEENEAKTVFGKLEGGKLSINKKEFTCRVLEGEEEETYLDKVKQEIKNLKNRSRHQGRKGFRGKRSRSPTGRDGIPQKKAKC